jgi:hypothetical protein
MKFVLAMSLALALGSTSALAQGEQKPQHPDADAAAPMDMSKMTPAELHKHCSSMMGGKMQGRPKHDHTAEKLGHAPAHNKPSDAEMKAMHDKCAAVMKGEKKPPAG